MKNLISLALTLALCALAVPAMASGTVDAVFWTRTNSASNAAGAGK